MNHGGVGARSLNIELQAALNPAGERKVERFGWTFAPGDKVMQIENDYDKEVYNGDIGYVGDVDPETAELTVSFDGRAVTYGFGKLDVLVPAYAATIHKSQGSEYPALIIPVLTQHYPMLQRNLLYTGITRGKRLVVLVGQKRAVAIAVRNASCRRRWSKLDEWLRLSASRGSAQDPLEKASAPLRATGCGALLPHSLRRDLGYTDNEPHEHISDVLFRQSRRCLSAKPVRERDPPRGDFFSKGKNWRLGCAGRSDLASMRAGASCLFISMSSRTICYACGVARKSHCSPRVARGNVRSSKPRRRHA